MVLREVLDAAAGDVEITGLAYDSRRVTPGTLFFAVPGFPRVAAATVVVRTGAAMQASPASATRSFAGRRLHLEGEGKP